MNTASARRRAHLALALLLASGSLPAPAQEAGPFGPFEAEEPGEAPPIESEIGPDALPTGLDRGEPTDPAFIPGVWRVDSCDLTVTRETPHPPVPSPMALAGIDYPADFPQGVVSQTIPRMPTERVEHYIEGVYGVALMEQAAAQIVLDSTAAEQLKAYAYRMLRSQDQIATDLRKLALCVGMELPEGLTPAAEEELAELRRRSGPNFAYRYLRMSLELNEYGIHAYQQLVSDLVDPVVRRFAKNYRPVLMIMNDQAQSLMGGMVPIAGRELSGAIAYFNRHGDLGRPYSRSLSSVDGPPPRRVAEIMPSNRQPATGVPYHKPPVQQWLRAGPGLGPEPAPIPEEIDQQTLPAQDDVYVRGIPDSRNAGLDFPPPVENSSAAMLRLELGTLVGRTVLGPEGETVGEIEEVQVEAADPPASQLIVALDRLLGDRRIAINVSEVTVRPLDGAVLVTAAGLAEARDLTRPVTPPPVSGVDPPARALGAPATSTPDRRENFGFVDQDEESEIGEGGPNQDPRRKGAD